MANELFNRRATFLELHCNRSRYLVGVDKTATKIVLYTILAVENTALGRKGSTLVVPFIPFNLFGGVFCGE